MLLRFLLVGVLLWPILNAPLTARAQDSHAGYFFCQ